MPSHKHVRDIKKGEDLYLAGQHTAALALFESVLRKDPENVAALNDAGIAADETGDTVKAVEYYERALAHDERNQSAFFNLIDLLARAEAADLALEVFEKYGASIPDSKELRKYADIFREEAAKLKRAPEVFTSPSVASCRPPDDMPLPPADRTGWPWTSATPPLSETRPDGTPWPKITIVTPSYNQGRFIEETIRSILLQGYPNLEYIVIDGGSSDETVSILEKYSPWITYWVSEPDQGQSHAINKGFARATGLLGNWINSDDLLCQGALVEHAKRALFETNRLYAGNLIVTHEDGRFMRRQKGEIHSLLDLVRIREVWRSHPRVNIGQPEVLFPLELFRAVGGLNIENHGSMDYELWGDMLLHGAGITYTGIDFGIFRAHEGQKTADFQATTESLVDVARSLVERQPTWSSEEKVRLIDDMETYRQAVRKAATQSVPPAREPSRTPGMTPAVAQVDGFPSVSVFMPTYNHEAFIAEAIESALLQDYPNLEIVIGDDASTDRTREIVDEYHAKYPDVIKRVYAEANQGITRNCNRTLEACSGEYIAFTAGDDVWLPGKIHKQIEWFRTNPDHVFCCGRVEVFNSETGREIAPAPRGSFEEIFSLDPVSRIYRLGQALSSVMIKRHALPDGGYDERLSHASDFLLLVEVLTRGAGGFIDEVLARYRKHANSASNATDWICTDHLMVYKILEMKHPELAPVAALHRKRTIAELFHLHHGDPGMQAVEAAAGFLGKTYDQAMLLHGSGRQTELQLLMAQLGSQLPDLARIVRQATAGMPEDVGSLAIETQAG